MGSLVGSMLKIAIEDAKAAIGVTKLAMGHTKTGEKTVLSYRILEIIGRGSFGLVSKVETGAQSIAALKTIYQDNRYINRELDILKSIEHPNVVCLISYFYSGKTKKGRFLNMFFEYVPVNLEDFVKDKTRSIDLIKDLYKQALMGLKYIHGLGIAHRDIKPANLLLDSNMRLKICDFGSAKYITEASTNICYICSRYYRAPELLMGCEHYSTKVDLWSLGAVFCEFRLSTPLFAGKNTQEMLERIFKVVSVSSDEIQKYGPFGAKMSVEENLSHLIKSHFGDDGLVSVLISSLKIESAQRISAAELLDGNKI